MYNVVIPFDQAASCNVLEISQWIDAMLFRNRTLFCIGIVMHALGNVKVSNPLFSNVL
jgi:hypothetical protein